MKQFGGWMLPDHEEHLQPVLAGSKDVADGRLRYQGKKQALFLKHVRNFRVCVDVGAHCGLWSFYLAKSFRHVHAFEPIAEHRDCFRTNCAERTNITLHHCALASEPGFGRMYTRPGSSGDSWIAGEGTIPLRPLDEFHLLDVDAMKLDCEGGELHALMGATDTIERCRPTIIVEQKQGKADGNFGLPERAAVDYLIGLGYGLVEEFSGDFVLVPGAA